MIGSIILKPYIALDPHDRDFIVILCFINIVFCIYYLMEVIRLEKVFKLENKNIIRFGKRLGIVTILYTPHFFFFISIFFKNLHNLEIMMAFLISLIEAMLICVALKEVFDLVFLEESQRDFKIEENRKKYIEKEKKPILGEIDNF